MRFFIVQVFYCPPVHTSGITAGIHFDCPIGKLDVFFPLNDFHEVGKEFSISAFGVQTVKNDFHIVILRVADFSFLPFSFLLLRSQHRHPLLSVWIFFVILEAVFVVSCFSFLNSTCGRPSTAYLFTASQVPCHYSHWDKEWLLPSHEGISIQHFTGCNCLRVPSFPRSDIPIMGHL